jgi:hypothetical protein
MSTLEFKIAQEVKSNMILQIDNFVIKEKKYKEFQDWVKANKENLIALGKKAGQKYRGTYYYALGTGAHVNAGGCFMWELSKYGDIDTSLTLFKDPKDEKISRELNELLVNMPTSSLLLRPIGEALIYKGT